MEINLKNVEELIFYDKKIRSILPEFRQYFDQWQLGQQIFGMKTLAQRSILDLMNSLKKEHIQKLEEYFGDIIILNKIDRRLVSHYEGSLDANLCEFAGYRDFCLSRGKDQMYISFWR